MTHTPRWIIDKCCEERARARSQVLGAMISEGYSLKRAKRWLRDYEDLGLIEWNEYDEIRRNWVFRKSAIAVPSLTKNSEK